MSILKSIKTAELTTNAALAKKYEQEFGKMKDDDDAISTIAETLKEEFGHNFLTMEVKNGIGEYYRLIQARDLPALAWIIEAIRVASKKTHEKRNFEYVIGILRSWLKNGYGHIPNQEEEDIFDYFQEEIGHELTDQSRAVIRKLMATYGSVKVTRMIASIPKDSDISTLMALQLFELLREKYPEK